ncbi:MAG: MltA domain-containing protein [Pseudomonadota bacterium]
MRLTQASLLRLSFLGALVTMLAACAIIPKVHLPGTGAPPSRTGDTAAALGVNKARSFPAGLANRFELSNDLASFVESCRVATSRRDLSGLTQPEDWNDPCDAARNWPSARAADFFETKFVPIVVGDGAAFATGYFEPEIRGSRTRQRASDVPVYGVPSDLKRCWRRGTPQSERTGRAPLSRQLADGTCVAHYTRAEIERGALDGRAPVIGYAADPVEFFFLQIQGSGRLVTETGEVLRIGYAGQNGHSYTGIGGVMRERGLLGEGPGKYAGSMQGIMQYLRENPRDGADLMRLNESWVFFRELTGDGPLGSIGVPVRARRSVAVDPRFVPYGAPVVLDLDRDEADGIWIAQDTGGAIKGANRFDTFWGAGAEARRIAGGMSGRGRATVLIPLASARRLGINP